MENQIKIALAQSGKDRILARAPWLIWCGLVCMIGLYFEDLPDQVPVHFNGSGQADSYSSKVSLFFIPALYAFLNLLLLWLAKKPHKHNYLVELNDGNRERQYRLSQNLMRYLAVIIGLNFLWILFQTIQLAINGGDGLSLWFLAVFLISIFGAIGVYVFISLRNK